jgi:putative ATPase
MASPRAPRAGLFDNPAQQPLAERMRPRQLDEVVGQAKWLGPDGFLRQALQSDRLPSLILWGPPGVGKTTLARVIAAHSRSRFAALSAVLDGVQQLREVVAAAEHAARNGEHTILFVDEVHRWGKAQQDALLPHVEAGTLILVGATTENPSFSLTSALLSRAVLVTLEALDEATLVGLLERALREPRGLGNSGVTATEAALQRLAQQADGDARRALNLLETSIEVLLGRLADGATLAPVLEVEHLDQLPMAHGPRYDRQGDEHYHVISAFIKSVRGSDPDAALYWLARMLAAGEDPRFICRRLVILAAEDVGNADPQALVLANATAQTHELCGLPESRIAMAQAVTYLACAPKSKAAYLGLAAAMQAVEQKGTLPVPEHLRNPSSAVGRTLGWGSEYRDPHRDGGFNDQGYLPERLAGTVFYEPTHNGVEARIADRLAVWRGLRKPSPAHKDS